jgi:hypothetical protein
VESSIIDNIVLSLKSHLQPLMRCYPKLKLTSDFRTDHDLQCGVNRLVFIVFASINAVVYYYLEA